MSAAYRLQQDGWQVKVLEASNSVGGRANTDSKNGYLIDTGASVMVTSYHAYFDLIDELGMTDDMVKTNPIFGIARGNVVHEINLDKIIRSGLSTKAFSLNAKLRLLKLGLTVMSAKAKGYLDYTNLSKGAPIDTESIRDFATRELGQELCDYLCEPLGRIMVICDGDELTKLELLSGVANVVGAEMKTLAGGVNAITNTIAESLNVQLNCKATQVKEIDGGVEVSWVNSDGSTSRDNVDACVVASKLPDAQSICPDYQDVLKPLNDHIDYTSAITVAVGTTVRPNTDAFLIPISPAENQELALMFMDHNKCNDRAPTGKYLINTHWGNRASTDNVNTSDDEIIERTVEQLCHYFPEIRGNIDMTHVARWPVALPITAPGTYKEIAKFNAGLNKNSKVQFAGDYMSAAGQNTAVLYGKNAADNLIATFSSSK